MLLRWFLIKTLTSKIIYVSVMHVVCEYICLWGVDVKMGEGLVLGGVYFIED